MGKSKDDQKRREGDAETTQRLPHLSKALAALEAAENATKAERESVKYEPKDYTK
jgi:hypothetical protein